MVSESRVIELSYRLKPRVDAWELPELPVPESHAHRLLVSYLVALLSAWVERQGRDALVVSNLALRWIEAHPKVGLDPDVALLEPAPPEPQRLRSLCTWKPVPCSANALFRSSFITPWVASRTPSPSRAMLVE